MKWRYQGAAVGLTGWLLLVTACNPAESPEIEDAAALVDPAYTDTDASIATNVRARFFKDETVKSQHVAVRAENGVVTLSGTVDREDTRTQAASIARQVEGVTRVQNDLQVAGAAAAQTGAPRAAGTSIEGTPPPSASGASASSGAPAEPAQPAVDPSALTTRIRAAYFAHPEVKRAEIDVSATPAGVVTLQGQVDSEVLRQEAIDIARGVDGVRDVTDQLQVMPTATAAAQAAGPEGPLPTSGTVTRPAQPAPEARPTQPASADAGQAAVVPAENPPAGDARITTRIESRLFLDSDLKRSSIEVNTVDGVVTLSGTVESPAERRQAIAIARAIDGVQDVQDELQVGAMPAAASPGSGMPASSTSARGAGRPDAAEADDEWITTRIQSTFYMDPDLKVEEIEVSSQDGVVTLAGTASSDDDRQTAAEIARGIEGVDEVINEVQVGN